MRYVARRDLKLGNTVVPAGVQFESDNYGNRRWRSMQTRGEIDVVREDSSASIAPVEEAEVEVSPQYDGGAPPPSPTRGELLSRLESAGYEEEDIQGTGSKGYVTVQDLSDTLEALGQ